jgi:hypothetical protein
MHYSIDAHPSGKYIVVRLEADITGADAGLMMLEAVIKCQETKISARLYDARSVLDLPALYDDFISTHDIRSLNLNGNARISAILNAPQEQLDFFNLYFSSNSINVFISTDEKTAVDFLLQE